MASSLLSRPIQVLSRLSLSYRKLLFTVSGIKERITVPGTSTQWRPVPVLNGGAAIDIVIYCFCRNFSREQSLKVNKP